jgi:DNA-directed RNA polymerase subunit RPC12/RpoP
MDEIIKKIDEEIAMYSQRIKNRQGACYHDESKRLLRFEERLHEAERIKEIILSMQQGETGTCEYTLADEESSTYECSKCGALWTFIDGDPEENKMRYCPECGRKIICKGNQV